MRVRTFYVMDDNFLLQKTRALRLLQLMQEHDKAWALYAFGSAHILESYTIEQLIALGISWLWIGLEGKSSQYEKLKGADTKSLVHHLQDHGIQVVGSSIIGLEEHTPQNIDEVIEWAVSHEADFHQFMLYTPPPGTPFYERMAQKNALRSESEIEWADIHGQWQFNYHHPHIKDGQESEFLLRAFHRDFDRNGPSIVRMISTLMNGWQKYKNHPEERIRRRFASRVEKMPVLYAGALWATRHWFRENSRVAAKIDELLNSIYREFGLKSRFAAPIVGRIVLHSLHREARRLQNGYVCEPPTFYESNPRAVTPKKKPA
jgi:hypothetical protein